MKNSFCWLQLQSTNLKNIKEFYTSLFDWKLSESPDKEEPYTHIDTGEGPGGGIMEAQKGCPPHWMPYVQVEDLDRYTRKAEKLGAKIIVPSTKIKTGGSFSVIQDPSGAHIGLYQP
ncbi:MAG: VOC family protein [Alphaproteobacteria bacterium]|nr:VOC family protein [Alphaproteobacteria bacterium]